MKQRETVLQRTIRGAALLLLGLLWLSAIVGLVYWGWIRNDIPTVAVILGLPLFAIWAFFPSLTSSYSDGRVLLYCRRFSSAHRIEDRNDCFENVLLDACTGMMIPVTLQDESIPSHYSSRMRIAAFIDTARAAAMFGAPIIVIALLQPWVSGIPVFIVFVVMCIAMLSAAYVATIAGYFVKNAVSGSHFGSVDRCIRRIARTKKSPNHLIVLRSSDEDWRSHVGHLLEVADAAVVDVSRLTENIQWEIDRALEVLGPGSVLFVKTNSVSNHISCMPTTGGDGEPGSCVLRMPYRSGSQANNERYRFAVTEALRTWLESRQHTPRKLASSFVERRDRDADKAKRTASRLFVGVTSVLAMYWLLRLARPTVEATLLAIVITLTVGAATWYWARRVFTSAVTGRSITETMVAGAQIALGGILMIYAPLAVIASIVSLVSDPEAWVVVWLVFMLLLPGVPVLVLYGAIVGAIVHALIFRPLTLK